MSKRLSVMTAAAVAEAELNDELAELERLGLLERVDGEPVRWALTPAAWQSDREAA
jgi:hypothetical protein